MLRVYTATHCPGYTRTRTLIVGLRQQQPNLSVELIDLDKPDIVYGDHFWFAWAAFKPETIIFGNNGQ